MAGAHPSSFYTSFTKPGKLRLYSTVELLALPAPTWLIDPIIPSGGLVGLYGPPGSFKSFVAIDMALSVAAGLPWHGHATQAGPVLYVSAEGSAGIGKRVHAWLTSKQANPDINITWLIERLALFSTSEDITVLNKRFDTEVGDRPLLIVIDTLARCFEGDENAQEDMGQFIAGVDRLRMDCDAAVLIVHHTRLGADRERGSTAFRGAADTMMSLTRDLKEETVILSCNKQKDAEEFADLEFSVQEVPGTGSCVVVPGEIDRSDLILAALGGAHLTYSALLDQVQNVPKSSFKRVLRGLLEKGKIIKENGYYSRKLTI